MAFVRCRTTQTKHHGETKSHQLIETYRENGRVKQRVLANLGDHATVEAALDHTRKAVDWTRRALARKKARGPRGGGRLARSFERGLAWWRHRLARQEVQLRALEAVVSESGRRRDVVDTTPLAKARRSVVRLASAHHETMITPRISGLQAGILKTLLLKRVPGARGCDASHPELLAAIWGWRPRRKLRWSEKDAGQYFKGHYRPGDPVPSSGMGSSGMFPDVPRREYRSARASLSRALTRLHKRGLIKFEAGTIGTYSHGAALTPDGEKIARLLAYPTVQRAKERAA